MSDSIRMSEATAKIAEALHNIQSELKPIEKKGRNNFQNYSYAKFEDYVDGIKEVLIKEGLSLITTVKEPKRLEPRKTEKGATQYGVEVAIIVRLFHKSGEWIEIDCYGEGQDSGDKAIYKAITGARKYALACLLGLATKDDPENDDDEARRDKQKGKGQQQSYQQSRQQPQQQNRQTTNQQSTKAASPPPANKTPPTQTAPATKPTGTPQQVESALSLAFDALEAAPDIKALTAVINTHWVKLKELTDDKEKFDRLRGCFNRRKSELQPPT
jgi:hypothetical protein